MRLKKYSEFLKLTDSALIDELKTAKAKISDSKCDIKGESTLVGRTAKSIVLLQLLGFYFLPSACA